MSDNNQDGPQKAKKSKVLVGKAEERLAKTFPWLKTSLGGLWTIFWIVMLFIVETIFIFIPILLVILGIGFIIFIILSSEGNVGLDIFNSLSSKNIVKSNSAE
jgi:hypothetical protein